MSLVPTLRILLDIYMKALRLSSVIIKMLVKDRLFYPGRLIADTLVMVGRFGILALLYKYVFELRGGEIMGVTLPVVLWSMFFYFAFMTLNIRSISRDIMLDVRAGTVEVLLSKPFSYLWYRISWGLGSGIYPFVVISLIGGTLLSLAVGVPGTITTQLFFATFVVTALLGVMLSFLMYGIVGLLAFWIEDISPIHWIIDKAVMILGGSYLPIALLPPLLYQFALWSPFGAANFVSHTAYASWSELWLSRIGIQMFWVVLLLIIMTALFAKARKNVSVNGG